MAVFGLAIFVVVVVTACRRKQREDGQQSIATWAAHFYDLWW